jgi:hypothetical protein
MNREVHVRFWERAGVRFLRAIHFPLYRQAQIYAREGVDLDRSTLAEWVGGCSRWLRPLVETLRRHVMSSDKLHGDDTPVPVLAPGLGKTKTGRLWTYVRDDRPAGDGTPPAVWFCYSPDRKGEHPQEHLSSFSGTLQADGFAGFEQIFRYALKTAASPQKLFSEAVQELQLTLASNLFSNNSYPRRRTEIRWNRLACNQLSFCGGSRSSAPLARVAVSLSSRRTTNFECRR